MLEPSQFSPNDAWILFRLNDAPIVTEADGDFNVLCLMDASSCYILGNDFVPIVGRTDPVPATRKLLESARDRAGCYPSKLLLSHEFESTRFESVAREIGADLASYSGDELAPFVSEAKEGFLAHVSGGRRQ